MMKAILRSVYNAWKYRNLKKFGKNLALARDGIIAHPEELEIGENVFIAKGFVISAFEMKIGSNIMIGPYLVAECDDHIYNVPGKKMYEIRKQRNRAPITVEDDVWMGANVTILKGVVVREGSIVGAGSVLTKSTVPYSISLGLPAKPFRTRFTEEELKSHLSKIKSNYSFEEILNFWKEAKLLD